MQDFWMWRDCIAWMLSNHRISQDGKDTKRSSNTIPSSLQGCLKVNHVSKSTIQTLWPLVLWPPPSGSCSNPRPPYFFLTDNTAISELVFLNSFSVLKNSCFLQSHIESNLRLTPFHWWNYAEHFYPVRNC